MKHYSIKIFGLLGFMLCFYSAPRVAQAVQYLLYDPGTQFQMSDGYIGHPVHDPNQRDDNGNPRLVGLVGSDGVLHDANPPHNPIGSYNGDSIRLQDLQENEYIVTESGAVVGVQRTPTPSPSPSPTVTLPSTSGDGGGGGGGGAAEAINCTVSGGGCTSST